MSFIRWVAALCLIAPVVTRAESVALTFDDLPLNGQLAPGQTYTGVTRDVLAIFKKQNIPPVYGFINSGKLEGSRDGAEALRAWVEGGQRVGSHTYSHPDLTRLTFEDFAQNIRQNEPALQLLDKSEAWRWFRYPYLHEGDTLEKRHQVRATLKELGYRVAQVTLDYEDYLWNFAYAKCAGKLDASATEWMRTSYLKTAAAYLDADRDMAKLVFGREINHVILLHLGAYSSTILPDLFALLKQKGFKVVTLEEAQKDAAYDTDPDFASKNGGTLLEQWMDARKIKYPDVQPKPRKELEALCQ
jgi:peptidoglycan/xylan/chitin deacetylase (PgdA/CDA1 family)